MAIRIQTTLLALIELSRNAFYRSHSKESIVFDLDIVVKYKLNVIYCSPYSY